MTLLLLLILDPLLLLLDLDLSVLTVLQLLFILFAELLLHFVLVFFYGTDMNDEVVFFEVRLELLLK